MRLTSLVGVGTLVAAAGCANWSPYRPTALPNRIDPPAAATPSAAQLVEYMRTNADRVTTLQVQSLDIDCKQRDQSAALEGWMVCRKGKDFRLGGRSIAGPEVDLGSNANEFWFWVKRADPPYLYHCSYADLAKGGVRLPFPFQPDAVMEALGLSVTADPARCEVRAGQGTFELIEKTTSLQGQPVEKVTVFDANRQDLPPTQPRVKQHLLRTPEGKVIASATVLKVIRDQTTLASIPQDMRLEYPSEQVVMRLRLDRTTVNAPLTEERAAALFDWRGLSNLRPFDLARDVNQPTSNAIQRTGGQRR